MILQRLAEFANRIPDLPPPMYTPIAFKWQIDLDDSGNYIGITPLSDGGKKDRGLTLMAPNVKRTMGVKPLLLADKAEYVLGLGSSSPKESRKFVEFLSLAESCANATHEILVELIVVFLKKHIEMPIQLPADVNIENGDTITFRIGNIRPIDLPRVRSFWASHNSMDSNEKRQCLVCGSFGPVDKVSPIAIKGLAGIGGQTSGMAIVSANKAAFLSYGAEQSLIAPTCRVCGEAYANSLNYMIVNDKYHIFVGPVVFVFWTNTDNGFNITSLFTQPDENDVKSLIESYRTGKTGHQVDSESFYALSLSASASRVVIRDWLDTTVPDVKNRLARWFELQKIVNNSGESRSYGVYALAASLYQKPNEQMIAEIPRALIRCALSGGALPDYILAQAVARNCAERSATRNRAALIKAVLLSQIDDIKEGYMEKLDTSNESPGYLCGRLLAELEAAQKAAIKPKTTLVDRFYRSASSAPASVFGVLMGGLQAHMSKLRRDRPDIYVSIDKNLQEITSRIGEFPKVLVLKEQAMFALGYYHQKTARWTKTDQTEVILEGDE
ncbi:MAG: type I-C CRISPR-associated protein Cas8c/Csd1 [Armatimonadota bacterium]